MYSTVHEECYYRTSPYAGPKQESVKHQFITKRQTPTQFRFKNLESTLLTALRVYSILKKIEIRKTLEVRNHLFQRPRKFAQESLDPAIPHTLTLLPPLALLPLHLLLDIPERIST